MSEVSDLGWLASPARSLRNCQAVQSRPHGTAEMFAELGMVATSAQFGPTGWDPRRVDALVDDRGRHAGQVAVVVAAVLRGDLVEP